MADDEDVVFKNSPLHQHLKNVGIGDESHVVLKASQRCTSHASTAPAAVDGLTFLSLCLMPFYFLCDVLLLPFKIYSTKNLCQHFSSRLCRAAIESHLLEPEDAHFLLNVIEEDDTKLPSRSSLLYFASKCVVTILLLGIFCFYLHDEAYLMCGLSIPFLMPMLVCLCWDAVVYFLLSRLHKSMDLFLQSIRLSCQSCRQMLRLVQELDLISRGFTLVPLYSPRARFHTAEPSPQDVHLRTILFKCLRNLFFHFKDATFNIACDDVLGLNCVYNIPLPQHGLSLEPGAEPNIQLSVLKRLDDLWKTQCSEFIKFFLVSTLQKTGPSIKETCRRFQSSTLAVTRMTKPCIRAIAFHRKCFVDSAKRLAVERRRETPLQIAVHSLCIHLQSVVSKVSALDACDGKFDAGLESKLESAKRELVSCIDCADEGLKHCMPTNEPKKPAEGAPPVHQECCGETSESLSKAIFDLGEPVIPDQVFVGCSDRQETIANGEDGDDLLMDSTQNRDETKRVLRELKAVIDVKAAEMSKREKLALERQALSPDDPNRAWLLSGEKGDQNSYSSSNVNSLNLRQICKSNKDDGDQTAQLQSRKKETSIPVIISKNNCNDLKLKANAEVSNMRNGLSATEDSERMEVGSGLLTSNSLLDFERAEKFCESGQPLIVAENGQLHGQCSENTKLLDRNSNSMSGLLSDANENFPRDHYSDFLQSLNAPSERIRPHLGDAGGNFKEEARIILQQKMAMLNEVDISRANNISLMAVHKSNDLGKLQCESFSDSGEDA